MRKAITGMAREVATGVVQAVAANQQGDSAEHRRGIAEEVIRHISPDLLGADNHQNTIELERWIVHVLFLAQITPLAEMDYRKDLH